MVEGAAAEAQKAAERSQPAGPPPSAPSAPSAPARLADRVRDLLASPVGGGHGAGGAWRAKLAAQDGGEHPPAAADPSLGGGEAFRDSKLFDPGLWAAIAGRDGYVSLLDHAPGWTSVLHEYASLPRAFTGEVRDQHLKQRAAFLLRVGVARAKRGEDAEAIRWYDESLLYATIVDALVARAAAKANLGHFNSATQDLVKALEIEPGHTRAQRYAATVRAKMEEEVLQEKMLVLQKKAELEGKVVGGVGGGLEGLEAALSVRNRGKGKGEGEEGPIRAKGPAPEPKEHPEKRRRAEGTPRR